MNGYLLANPESENLSQDYTGDETNLLISRRLKSASGKSVLKVTNPGRFQSLCLFGSSCESYNDHAIMEAEHSDSSKVDAGVPAAIDPATQKEIHDAIDNLLDEQDLDHTIKEGSPTNAFRSYPTHSIITLNAAPQRQPWRSIDSPDSRSPPRSAIPDRRWWRSQAQNMGAALDSNGGVPLSGHGASCQVRRALRAFRRYEAAAAVAAVDDAAAAALATQAAAEVRVAGQRRAAHYAGEAAPVNRAAAAEAAAAEAAAAPRSYPPLPAY